MRIYLIQVMGSLGTNVHAMPFAISDVSENDAKAKAIVDFLKAAPGAQVSTCSASDITDSVVRTVRQYFPA